MSTDRVRLLRDRYLLAVHAMQSAVAHKMALDAEMPAGESGTSPKHLRVGVNAAMVDHGALAALLIRKGVISEEEYFAATSSAMETEVENYRKAMNMPDNMEFA